VTALIASVIAVNAVVNAGGDILNPTLDTSLDAGAHSISFTTPKLTQDLHLVGMPEFDLFVSATDVNAYYYAELIEVNAKGSQHLVSRAAFKDSTADFGATHEIDFKGFSVNHLFQAGSQVRVRVASRDFPFFLPRSNQPTIKIYRNTDGPSHVILPVAP